MLKFIVAASLIVGTTAPALADQETAPAIRVHYGDLNLSGPDGQRVLQRRMTSAINSLCGSAPVRDLGQVMAVAGCRNSAARSASTQIAAVTKNVAFASAATRFEGGSR